MSKGDTSLIRKLVPIRWMFDLYTTGLSNQAEANSRSPCTTPFFSNGCVEFNSGSITTKLLRDDPKTLLIDFSSFCPKGHVIFETVVFSLENFIAQLERIIERKTDFISFDVNVSTDWLNEWQCSSYHACSKHEVCANINKLSKNSSSLFYKGSVTCVCQFKLNEVRKALAVYHGIEENEGGFNMKGIRNLFSGMEFGVNKDPHIKSTLTGIVVQGPNGEWFAFDPVTRTRKNMMGLKFGDFPIILVPVKNLTVGRLIKKDRKYYWVQSVNPDNTFTGVNAETGAVETFVLTDNLIPGLTFFTEVIAFDAKTLMDPASKQNMGGNVLGAMLMMKMMDGGDKAEFSLDDINDDSFNGLGMFLPMLMASKDGNLGITNPDGTPNIMMMMMMFGSGEGGANDIMKYTLLSSMLGGGNNTANPLGDIMSGFTSAIPGMGTTAPATGKGHFACTACGKEFDDPKVKFCTECGGPVAPKGTVCPVCGASLKEGAKFCHECGAKIGVLTCPGCGEEVSAEEKFCHNCGLNLKPTPAAEATPVTAPAHAAAKPTTRHRKPAGTAPKNPAPTT